MIGQKEAVVNFVKEALGDDFGKAAALNALSPQQLRDVKARIASGIMGGTISYGKNPADVKEVTSYASSMTMNHLKKARELNGGSIGSSSITKSISRKTAAQRRGIVVDNMPDYLKTMTESLLIDVN